MEFEKAGTLASENLEVLPAVLESFLAERDLSFPAKTVERVNRSNDPDPALTARVGALFLEYGYADRASTVLEKLVTAHRDSADVWRMLAQAYDRQDKPEQAYRAYARAIEADANAEDGYTALAEFASSHGNDDYALQVVDRGLEHLPQAPALVFEQGILCALKGDRKQAEDSFTEAGRLKPAWAMPFMALGVMRLESGDAAHAVVAFQRARALEPGDFRAHYLYATALSRDSRNSEGNRAEALGALRQAMKLNPKDARSHALAGQLDLEAGKVDGAVTEWQAALKIEPENPTALYQLGVLYQKRGKTAEARRLLEAFRRVKARMHGGEESLVQILRVVPGSGAPQRPMAARDSTTRER
jgi:Flp pilus assembly protein TadD